MATIDILMATYNGDRFVREQIESIQAQSFPDWRLLVSDDCSSDATVLIIKEMAKNDSRIVLISEGERYGSAKINFMFLLHNSEAPYVMFCDQDDVWLPEKIELTLTRMKELEAVKGAGKPLMVFTDMRVVDADLNIIHESFEKSSNIDPRRIGFAQLLAQSVGAGCTMMVNSDAVELARIAENDGPMVMHDWWLSLTCSAFGAIAYLGVSTSLYRQHGDNEVGAKTYNPLRRALQFEGMRESVDASVKQAIYFREVYGNMLDAKKAKVLDDFATACSSSGVAAVFRLAKSGCWKKGLRKIGQVAVVISNQGRLLQ